MFDNIAPRYDLINLVLSGGVVVYWDARFKRAVAQACAQTPAPVILDLGCGTLRLARGLPRHVHGLRLFGLDLSQAVLARGFSRLNPAAHRRLLAVQGEAAALPFPDNSLDCVISQFVWRNLSSRSQALAEIRRVLKPGGKLLILEFGCGQKRIWGGLYNFYLRRMLPRLAAFSRLPAPPRFAHPADRLRAEMERMMAEANQAFAGFDNFFDRDDIWATLPASPAMNMRERDDAYELSLALPDANPDSLDVRLDGRLLSVSSHQDTRTPNASASQSFSSRVLLPGPVAPDARLQVTNDNGRICIRIPKPAATTTASRKP